MWSQWARLNWFKQGDLNTAFFHKTTNMRKKKNMIMRLESGGKIIKEETRIIATFQEHFKKLFGSIASLRAPGIIPDCQFQNPGGGEISRYL